MRESCAYPEACEHPGVKLALIYNHSLLTIAERNSTINQLRTELAAVREERDKLQSWFDQVSRAKVIDCAVQTADEFIAWHEYLQAKIADLQAKLNELETFRLNAIEYEKSVQSRLESFGAFNMEELGHKLAEAQARVRELEASPSQEPSA